MPCDYSAYPPGWPQLSKRIRIERAGGRCECRGECGAEHDGEVWPGRKSGRCVRMNGDECERGPGRVVLTVAHLCRPEDHDPPGKCGQEDHLKAMCQACHLRLDHPIHVQHARQTRAKRQGVQELPGFAGAEDYPQQGDSQHGVSREPVGAGKPARRETDPRPEPESLSCAVESPAATSPRGEARDLPSPSPPTLTVCPGTAPEVIPALAQLERALVAVSDGTQDVQGFALLSGTPLPPGFRAWLPVGWSQPGPIAVCAECGHGTVLVDPECTPRHRSCERAAGVAP